MKKIRGILPGLVFTWMHARYGPNGFLAEGTKISPSGKDRREYNGLIELTEMICDPSSYYPSMIPSVLARVGRGGISMPNMFVIWQFARYGYICTPEEREQFMQPQVCSPDSKSGDPPREEV